MPASEPGSVAELFERAARPVLLVSPTERLTAWPQHGALIRVNNPAGVAAIHMRGDLPAWERARQLLEPPDA
jgi:hypothetical protein